MHPKQNAFTTADNGKLALGEGSHMGRKQGLQGAGAGLGTGLGGQGRSLEDRTAPTQAQRYTWVLLTKQQSERGDAHMATLFSTMLGRRYS